MSVKQISIFVENKPGKMFEMTEILAASKINLRGLSLAETEGFGIVRILVDDVYKATTLLKDSGYVNKISKVVLVPLPEDKPGALSEVLGILNEEKININYMYAVNGDDNMTYMVLKVNDSNAAELALEARGIHPGDQEVLTQV
ncbi:MAG: acetolactate synthase [Lachnospiraceae bacterium]|nr:acetolactate synthase [Lachnospiraceae bacterium]